MWIREKALDRVAEWIGIAEWEDYGQGFFFGFAVLLLLLVLIWLFKPLFSRKRKFKGVMVAGSVGNLYITINAIRQFIHRILTEFEEAALSSVSVREIRGQIVFSVELEVVPDVDLVPLRDRIQQRIVDDAENRLGIGMPIKVNLDIRSIEANAKRPSRSERKRLEQLRKDERPAVVETESNRWSETAPEKSEAESPENPPEREDG